MMSRSLRLFLFLSFTTVLYAVRAHAEPYIAVQQGYKCSSCHVNPTGGGLRNDFGMIYASTLMPQHIPASGASAWQGTLGKYLRVGGDLRASWQRTAVPGLPSDEQRKLDQLRLYASVTLWPGHLTLNVDEALAPGDARNLEGYARFDFKGSGFYAKAGQFYLPFGWRLQDQTAFVREVSGISMTEADRGIEVGYDRGEWSAQFDYTRGIANIPSGDGHQVTGQVAWVPGRYRLGAAVSLTSSRFGDRSVSGVFAGLRTGPVAWLGEADLVRDSGYPEGTRTLATALAEVDWSIHRGHNLKVTAEYFDPDRAVAEDQKVRWSALYEWTPVPFVQLRAGARRWRGIPQNPVDNRQQAFLELHAWF